MTNYVSLGNYVLLDINICDLSCEEMIDISLQVSTFDCSRHDKFPR